MWHGGLSVLPTISGGEVDRIVNLQSVLRETSVRGYKFFLEQYIHDVEGKYFWLTYIKFSLLFA